MKPIYLDYNATTPVDPTVLEAMLPYLRGEFGNPSSTHAHGKEAARAISKAREQVAELIGAQPEEIIFTSGGTEASNHAILGVIASQMQSLWGRWTRRPHLIISSVEHPATTEPANQLRRLGCQVSTVPVDRHCWVDPDAVGKVLRRGAMLVSIMHSNNEVGTLMPIREIAALARERGALMHTDVAQSLGKVTVQVRHLGVDLLTIAGHKLYAPKGIGALYVRQGVRLKKFMEGAGQENGQRAGTENVPYIVGLGQACELARQKLPEAERHLAELRDRLWHRLQADLADRVILNGHPEVRLPNTLNVNFTGHVGAELLQKMPEVAASTGSACHEGRVTQSAVLCAMGVPPETGKGALRLTVGRMTTTEEIDRAAEVILRTVKR